MLFVWSWRLAYLAKRVFTDLVNLHDNAVKKVLLNE